MISIISHYAMEHRFGVLQRSDHEETRIYRQMGNYKDISAETSQVYCIMPILNLAGIITYIFPDNAIV